MKKKGFPIESLLLLFLVVFIIIQNNSFEEAIARQTFRPSCIDRVKPNEIEHERTISSKITFDSEGRIKSKFYTEEL